MNNETKSKLSNIEVLELAPGEKAIGINKTANPKATQHVQRSSKRPVGKRKKKMMREGKPSTSSPIKATGNDQTGWTATRAPGILGKAPPKATRENEASQANQS